MQPRREHHRHELPVQRGPDRNVDAVVRQDIVPLQATRVTKQHVSRRLPRDYVRHRVHGGGVPVNTVWGGHADRAYGVQDAV